MSRCRPRRVILTVIISTVVLLVLHSFTSDNSKRHTSSESISGTQHHDHPKNIKSARSRGHRSLCILVPFRDRFEELTDFVPKISRFLDNQNIDHKIIVINQVSCMVFERISVGYEFKSHM